MDKPAVDEPQSAIALLAKARQDSATLGELVRLIMSGTLRLDSWLIEKKILPELQEKNFKTLVFNRRLGEEKIRTAAMLPLPDGSAFARSASGHWSALESHEALHEIQYIGFRYAPQNCWLDGFRAELQIPGHPVVPIAPADLAKIWQDITGTKPLGYKVGVVDQIQAFGYDFMDKAFKTRGYLGL